MAAGLLSLFGSSVHSQGQGTTARSDALQQLNASVESLVTRVSRSVVQVQVTTYEPLGGRDPADPVIARQRSLGSGFVIDPDGYILTNAHVVSNARRVQVVLPGAGVDAGGISSGVRGGRRVDAQIVGVAREIDLALLKVDGPLPALPIADDDSVRQGALVFAFGSPEGLRDSVTMGVVSAVARQPDTDSPLVYLQTDAPINPGNSGGPLVNVRGELVGINTFILSERGGGQGPGFAIPSALVRIAYPKLRAYGHLHRGQVGVQFQTVTPALAAGLGLSRDWGAMISDVVPGSPAATAGLQVQDIIVSFDGTPVDGVPRLAMHFFTIRDGEKVTLGVLRGTQAVTLSVLAAEMPHNFDRLMDAIDPDRNAIPALGILGIDLSEKTAPMIPSLRRPSGVIVLARTALAADGIDLGLTAGDVIFSINGAPVISTEQLRAVVAALKRPGPIVVQIQRNDRLMFLTAERD
jgi:serine protease Do